MAPIEDTMPKQNIKVETKLMSLWDDLHFKNDYPLVCRITSTFNHTVRGDIVGNAIRLTLIEDFK